MRCTGLLRSPDVAGGMLLARNVRRVAVSDAGVDAACRWFYYWAQAERTHTSFTALDQRILRLFFGAPAAPASAVLLTCAALIRKSHLLYGTWQGGAWATSFSGPCSEVRAPARCLQGGCNASAATGVAAY